MTKATKRIGPVGPNVKEVLALARKQRELATELVQVAERLDAKAKLVDAASALVKLEIEEREE